MILKNKRRFSRQTYIGLLFGAVIGITVAVADSVSADGSGFGVPSFIAKLITFGNGIDTGTVAGLDSSAAAISADANAAALGLNIPVTGSDSGAHAVTLNVDGTAGVSVTATGNGAGGVGVPTIAVGTATGSVVSVGQATGSVTLAGTLLPVATQSAAGFMSAADKTTLDNQPPGETTATVQTTDVTTTTIATVAIPANEVTVISLRLYAQDQDSAGSVNYYERVYVFYRVTSVEFRFENDIIVDETVAAWTHLYEISGTNVLLRVIGENGRTVNWSITYAVQSEL